MKTKKRATIDPDNPPLTREALKGFRRATPAETEFFRQAIENTTGVPRPPRTGRPWKYAGGRLQGVYIKLHPRVLAWARAQAKERKIGYQTVINETLMQRAA